MSVDNKELDFEKLLAKPEVDKIIEFLIKDHAFTTEFLASTIANYYLTMNKLT